MSKAKRVGFFKSITGKISLAFGLMTVLVAVCGTVGYVSSHRLAQQLEHLGNDIYQTASNILITDGSNNNEDKIIERILANMSDGEERKLLPLSTAVTDAAYAKILEGNLLPAEVMARLETARKTNFADVDAVLLKDQEYADQYGRLTVASTALINALSEIEAFADGVVERLSATPDEGISWNGGLGDAWTAADGAMEATIGVMQQNYYFEGVLSGQDESVCLAKIAEGKEIMEEATGALLASGVAAHVLADGALAGKSVGEVLPLLIGTYNDALAATVAINTEKTAMINAYRASADVLKEAYAGAVNAANAMAQETLDSIPAIERSVVVSIIGTLLISILLAAGAAVVATRMIVKPLNFVVERLQDIAEGEGDLTRRLKLDRADEIGTLGFWFDTFIDKIHNTVKNVANCTQTLSAASEQTASTSSEMSVNAEGMTTQSTTAAAATEQASTSIRNVAAAIEEISANSSTVATESEHVSSNLTSVGTAVEEVSGNMNTIAAAVEEMSSSLNTIASSVEEMSTSLREVSNNTTEAAGIAGNAAQKANATATTVNRLGASAQEIDKVVDLITGIAEQTNLLALNAAIEAASAGEAGKGFAVVANEVKELAKQTARATQDIRGQVEGMQANTNEAVTAIGEIVDVIGRVNDVFGLIAAAVQQQTSTINEIVRNVNDAAHGSAEVSHNVQEAARGSMTVSGNVQEAIASVNSIARSVAELAIGANEIARNAGEASQGMNEVAQNVLSVNGAAQVTRNGAEDLKGAAQGLAGLASQLQGLVGSFSV